VVVRNSTDATPKALAPTNEAQEPKLRPMSAQSRLNRCAMSRLEKRRSPRHSMTAPAEGSSRVQAAQFRRDLRQPEAPQRRARLLLRGLVFQAHQLEPCPERPLNPSARQPWPNPSPQPRLPVPKRRSQSAVPAGHR